jgi:CBS-domain-containing membrane protein
MARTRLDEAAGLTVADVTHSRVSVLPADATVGAVRAWFAESDSRKLALLADDGRYVGCLVPADVADGADPGEPAAARARRGPTVSPDAPAKEGEELALTSGTLRAPVVDSEGTLLGVVAVTADLQGFCGTGGSGGC